MSMQMKSYVLCLTVLFLALTGCRDESPVLVEVRPSEDVPGTLVVSLRNHFRETAGVSQVSTSLKETIDGHSFIGVLATESAEQVKVLAAKQANREERIRVIVETTRPLRLTVRFDKDGGNSRGPVVKTFPPGNHDVLATPAGLSESAASE
jgi:hypothetical protein